MSKTVSGKRLLRILEAMGFEVFDQTGSHCLLRKRDQEGNVFTRVTIPVHANKDLKRKTLETIRKQAGIEKEAFYEML